MVRPIGSRMKVVARAPYYQQDETYDDLVAICYGRYLKGRIAWSGVRIGASPSGDETAERAFRELFANMIVWLTDRPRITTPTWPGNCEAALGLVLEAPESSALRFFAKIKEIDHPLGMLVTPKQAREFSEIPGIESLPVEWILHIDSDYLHLVEEAENSDNLKITKRRVEEMLRTVVAGVRVDDVRSRDVANLALEAGFSYLLAPPTDGIEEYPEIYASMREMGPLEAPVVLSLAPFRESLPERISPTDCFFVLLPAETFLDTPLPLRFPGIEENQELWMTYPAEIVNWRSDRNSVVMDQEFLPDDRLRLRISNGSYTEFHQFPFTIGFGDEIEEVLVWPKAVGQAPPDLVSRNQGNWSYEIERFRPG
ncbi:MAG: hypothetical protein ACQKBT_11205, partial [Puniceicoccales bacterium]